LPDGNKASIVLFEIGSFLFLCALLGDNIPLNMNGSVSARLLVFVVGFGLIAFGLDELIQGEDKRRS
jgi:hypothetical protein